MSWFVFHRLEWPGPYKWWPEDWGNDDGSMEVEAMYEVDDVADRFSWQEINLGNALGEIDELRMSLYCICRVVWMKYSPWPHVSTVPVESYLVDCISLYPTMTQAALHSFDEKYDRYLWRNHPYYQRRKVVSWRTQTRTFSMRTRPCSSFHSSWPFALELWKSGMSSK